MKVHILEGNVGPAHPEKLPSYRVQYDCVTLLGYPDCMGAAAMGPEHCTCQTLTDEDHAKCVADAKAAFEARNGEMCHDCAFRKGSPESEQLYDIAISEKPFRCHQGAPVNARGGVPVQDAYVPRMTDGEALDYPICAGWLKARHVKSLPLGTQSAPDETRGPL